MKQRLTSYTFDASEKTVLAAQFSDVTLAGIQLIVNVTDQIIIYNFADTSKGGTLATDTLTLEYDTTTMSDTDELMILVDDGVQTVAVTSATLATAANQATMIGHLDGVETTLTAIDGRVDGIEALLTTIDADTGSILGAVDGIEALLGTMDADTSAMVVDLAAIEVLLTTIESNQLADGHNVTVDNASIAVTGTFWQATQPISGTVTAELSATDNAVLDNIDADLTTIIGHVDGIEAVLGTIDADTGSIMTAVQLIDDVVYTDDTSTHATGTSKGVGIMAAAVPTDTAVNANDIGMVGMTANRELYVSLTTAIPAGANNIGDVDILSIVPGTAATNLGKAVDAAPGATDTGVMALALRDDTLNIRSGTEGDYEPLHTNANGALWSIDVNSAAQLTALQLIDNTIFVDDAAFTVGVSSVSAMGLMADEASTDSVDEGDIGIPRMTVNRKQIVTDRSATAAQTSVSSSATNVTLLAANTSREGATLYNDSTQICYVRLQATATSSNFSVKMQPEDYYEVPAGYTGIIDGIWASANGNMRVTELT